MNGRQANGRRTRRLRRAAVLFVGAQILAAVACAADTKIADEPVMLPDVRTPVVLSGQTGREHRRVMTQHLETVQAIVAALAAEDFERAQALTETHLGFFMHRQAMASQEPERFPPAYHDLAMAHHEAAEELARVMPSKDFKQILPKFDGLLRACVACHAEFKVEDRPELRERSGP
jgi:hypothetical protein